MQIGSNLKLLAERRTDIFGVEETFIGQKIGEEEMPKLLVYSGMDILRGLSVCLLWVTQYMPVLMSLVLACSGVHIVFTHLLLGGCAYNSTA